MDETWISALAFDRTWRMVSFIGGGGKTTAISALASELAQEGYSVLITTTTKIWYPENPDYDVVLRETTDVSQSYPWQLGLHARKGSIVVAAEAVDEAGKLRGFDLKTLSQIKNLQAFDVILVEADGSKGRSLKAHGTEEPVVPIDGDFCYVMLGCDVFGKPLDDRWVHRSSRFAAAMGIDEKAHVVVTPELCASWWRAPEGYLAQCPLGQPLAMVLTKLVSPARLSGARKIRRLLHEDVRVYFAPVVESAPAQGSDRRGIYGVLLAAGIGSRFSEHGGTGKLLSDFLGEPQVVWTTRVLLASDLEAVMVVYENKAVRETLEGQFPLAVAKKRLYFAENVRASEGQSTSVQCGMLAAKALGFKLGRSPEGYLFAMADQLMLTPETVGRLIAVFEPGSIVQPCHGKQSGSPVIFAKELESELLLTTGDRGGRDIIKRNPERVIQVEVCIDELKDVDSPADLEQIMKQME